MDNNLICKTMKWQEIIGISIKPDPPVKELVPGFIAAILFYFLSFIVCYLAFRISRIIFPKSIHSVTTEFFKTMLICTYPYGHGQIRQLYGSIGYFLTVVPLAFFTIAAFPDGHGSPLTTFLEFLKGRVSFYSLVFRSFVQTLGAFTSYKLAMFVWSLRIHSFHTSQFNSTVCSSDLKVSLEVGFVLELLCVAFDTWLNFQKLSRFPVVDSVLKISNCALMVCLGVHLTGMYLHPAMASGLSFFCNGTSALDHILVYWISSFLGCYLGNVIHVKVTSSKFETNKSNGSSHEIVAQTGGISKKTN
ncbi:aquaporin-12B-like [Patella vulgata]|uniref:aquaporin-12B-like n=1 Tax=Patella vulgata TaxID=6465 RepID=UPI00217F9758|nr:aquaporin-12B-like [Patella vulgata]